MNLILAMTIASGLGTLTGPVIGATPLVVMWEIMRDVNPYAHMLSFATLVIVEMKLFRAGIFGIIAERLKARGLIRGATVYSGVGSADSNASSIEEASSVRKRREIPDWLRPSPLHR